MSRQSLEHTQPLLPGSTHVDDLDKEYPFEPARKFSCRLFTLVALLMVSLLLNFVQFIERGLIPYTHCASDPQQLYSKRNGGNLAIQNFELTRRPAPAHDVLEYEIRKFPRARYISKYHGPPSDQVDQAWEDLYSCKYIYRNVELCS